MVQLLLILGPCQTWKGSVSEDLMFLKNVSHDPQESRLLMLKKRTTTPMPVWSVKFRLEVPISPYFDIAQPIKQI